MSKIKKAVIPAAGFGTRFLPYTKALPKEMICVVDKPAIQLIVEEAVNSGIEEILIITSRNKNAIENHFDRVPELELHLKEKGKMQELELINDIADMAKFYYVRQQEMLGLGHAILHARAFTKDEPFAVLLGDDVVVNEKPCLKQLMDVYDEYECSVLGVQSVEKSEVSKYGIVSGDKISERLTDVKDFTEKPKVELAKSNTAVLGRYILTPDIYDELLATQKGAGGEIQLTDAIAKFIGKSKLLAYNFEGRRYDTGDKLGYLEAVVEFALANPMLKDKFRTYLENLVRQ